MISLSSIGIFLLGLFVGVFVGMFAMGLCQAAAGASRAEELVEPNPTLHAPE